MDPFDRAQEDLDDQLESGALTEAEYIEECKILIDDYRAARDEAMADAAERERMNWDY